MSGTGKGDARRMIFSVKVIEKKKKNRKRLKTSLFEIDFQVVRIIRWYYQARLQSRTVELQREPAVNNQIHQRR